MYLEKYYCIPEKEEERTCIERADKNSILLLENETEERERKRERNYRTCTALAVVSCREF